MVLDGCVVVVVVDGWEVVELVRCEAVRVAPELAAGVEVVARGTADAEAACEVAAGGLAGEAVDRADDVDGFALVEATAGIDGTAAGDVVPAAAEPFPSVDGVFCDLDDMTVNSRRTTAAAAHARRIIVPRL